MALYGQLYAKISGVLLFENQRGEVSWPDNDTDVNTVLGGAAGVSPGPDQCMFSVDNAVKSAESDIDLVAAKLNRTELQIEIGRIGVAATITGTFLCREVRMASGTAEPTIETASFTSLGTCPRPSAGW